MLLVVCLVEVYTNVNRILFNAQRYFSIPTCSSPRSRYINHIEKMIKWNLCLRLFMGRHLAYDFIWMPAMFVTGNTHKSIRFRWETPSFISRITVYFDLELESCSDYESWVGFRFSFLFDVMNQADASSLFNVRVPRRRISFPFVCLFCLFVRTLYGWWTMMTQKGETVQTTIDGTAWWSVSVCEAITADSHPHAESLILIRKKFPFFNFTLTHCVHCPLSYVQHHVR